ncbi:MAG TPA: carboxypeptidase regulatory-like domain-containing protein [Blastocatellia bacterium]|nr:carboxypeptidase regulatory-like domain-containing protein [Blastocatellia bacterium]
MRLLNEYIRRKNTGVFALGILLIIVASLTALAQSGAAVVRGTVTDQQGKAISGAKVTLTDLDKNLNRVQTTSEEGIYVFNSIAPGSYRIEVEAANFKKVSIGNVVALVDTPREVNLQLEVGAVTEALNVTASNEAPINTTDASLGNAFENKRVVELPLNARNIVGLLSLQAGVTRQGEVNGGRRDQANITIDGIDANEQQTGLDVVAPAGNGAFNPGVGVALGNALSAVLRTNPDAVQEFRVTTSNPNASQGRSSGAQISLVTKSGTNGFHGSLYEFHRNTITSANDWFNNSTGRFVATDQAVIDRKAEVGDLRNPRPKLIRNVFGGSLGGPVIKDRVFFFFSYEGRRDAAQQSVLRNVPTETLRNGIVRYRNTSGGITTLTPADIARIYPATGGVNPAGLDILRTAPLPNDFSIGDGLNRAGFRFNAPISTRLNASIARFDYTINEKHNVFFRGNYQEDLYGGAPNFPGTPATNFWVHPKGFGSGHTWTISNNLINNVRVGLTRAALSSQGDNSGTSVAFRDVFSPLLNTRTQSRTNPTWNFTDDLTWVKSSHTAQFGMNIRAIRNNPVSFANSFDAALVNFQFYQGGGASLLAPAEIASTLDSSFGFDYGRAAAAALGRFTQYSINSVFDKTGQALAVGTPATRTFATEEYDLYGQDVWKIRPNLTLTYGLRYSLNTPVYEKNGLQLVPNVVLGDFLERRLASAEQGQPLNELITFQLGGKANNGPNFYSLDKNNFAPNVSIAWSPNFGEGFFGRIIGRGNQSVIRAGFRMLYDRVGSQLAVASESENSFGFSSTTTNGSNSTNVTTNLGPLVALNPNVRQFPRINAPSQLTFPLGFPADETDRIIAGIDQAIISPVQYTWNFSIARELPKGFSFEVGYIGRAARNLLLTRDVMHLNNLRDPASGQDWYTAARILNELRNANTAITSVGTIPFFQKFFPGIAGVYDVLGADTTLTASQAAYYLHAKESVGGLDDTDFTDIQFILDDAGIFPNAFFHPQYAALQTLSSVGRSNYHAGFFTLRQRFGSNFLFDFNYTLSKSMDNSSTLETQRVLSTVIRNPIAPNLEYSVSDFDVTHSFNANWLLALPFGKQRKFFGNVNSVVDGIIGGWQLTGITRFNTGLPTGTPGDIQWATNWQSQSDGVRLRDIKSSPSANVDGRPNLFANPLEAYRSFRNARAGEVGDRNLSTIRLPRYFVLDAGLSKNFKMGYAEGHLLQFRWEVFNVTNTQPFGGALALNLLPDPFNATAPSAAFGRFTGSQTPVGEPRPGRVMQFALRYSF